MGSTDYSYFFDLFYEEDNAGGKFEFPDFGYELVAYAYYLSGDEGLYSFETWPLGYLLEDYFDMG